MWGYTFLPDFTWTGWGTLLLLHRCQRRWCSQTTVQYEDKQFHHSGQWLKRRCGYHFVWWHFVIQLTENTLNFQMTEVLFLHFSKPYSTSHLCNSTDACPSMTPSFLLWLQWKIAPENLLELLHGDPRGVPPVHHNVGEIVTNLFGIYSLPKIDLLTSCSTWDWAGFCPRIRAAVATLLFGIVPLESQWSEKICYRIRKELLKWR